MRQTDAGPCQHATNSAGRSLSSPASASSTSLGAGKADNWAKLTAGESGIKHHHPLPDRRPENHDGRHDRLRHSRASVLDRTVRAPRQIVDRRSARAGRHRNQGRFSRARCFLPWRPSKPSGRSGSRSARQSANPTSTIDDVLRISGGGKFAQLHHRFMFGSVADPLAETFGTKGSPISLSTACASGATAIQLGVEAIRRGETDAALCVGDRRLGQSGSADPLLAAVGAVDPERPAAGRLEAVLQEPRRLCHGRRRRRAGAGKL